MNENKKKSPTEMLDDALDYIVESCDDARFTFEECLGINKESLNAIGIDRFDYIFENDEDCTLLDFYECNALNKIASATKMDCWFFIANKSEHGNNYNVIDDLEEGVSYTIKQGLILLASGIAEPLNSDFYSLSEDEYKSVCNLFNKYNISVPMVDKLT